MRALANPRHGSKKKIPAIAVFNDALAAGAVAAVGAEAPVPTSPSAASTKMEADAEPQHSEAANDGRATEEVRQSLHYSKNQDSCLNPAAMLPMYLWPAHAEGSESNLAGSISGM